MNDKFIRGLALGIGLAVATAIFVPGLAQAARPAARRGIKLGMRAYMQGREAVASFIEIAEDAYAEASADLKEEAEPMTEAGEPGVEPEESKVFADGADPESTKSRNRRS